MGRPSTFTQAQADDICEKLEKGQSLRFICDDEAMPHRDTVREWLKKDAAFAAQYARAKEYYADEVFEEILEIADDSRNDFVERHTNRGTFIALDDEAVQRARLRIDARKWMLGKLAPKKYGDKLEVEATVAGEIKITIGGDA